MGTTVQADGAFVKLINIYKIIKIFKNSEFKKLYND